jgi:hypothetical protein
MAYSLLEKVSYFLNHYLALGIPERRTGFRSFWYDGQERQRGLRPEFDACDNWPLRGLFWLSKDLFENAAEQQIPSRVGVSDRSRIRVSSWTQKLTCQPVHAAHLSVCARMDKCLR